MLYSFSYTTDYRSHYAQTNLLALQIIAKWIGRKTIIHRIHQVQIINNPQPVKEEKNELDEILDDILDKPPTR